MNRSSVKAAVVILLSFSFFTWFGGCTFDKSFPDLSTNGNAVCFETDVLPLIQSNCAKSGCHDADTKAEGYDFSNYDGIMKAVKPYKPNNSKLYKVLTGNGEDKMPPAPNEPLNNDQVNTIKTWIEEGATDGPCNTVTCDTANVTYSGTIVPILQTSCLGCHANASTGGGILLNNYPDVFDQAMSGALMNSIQWTGSVTPMPENGNQLDDCSIKMFEIWVNDGALNN
ncbi:MAG: hypothetical protein K1X61_03715 [Chitinophagales bacterium]|nr:hypothetical protein [Chitinophagales bacterium]